MNDESHAREAPDRDHDPRGPADGAIKIQKGGSDLCHDCYCRQIQPAARQGEFP